MKSLIVAVSLSAALIAWPAIAQQGPAGVPGAYGLAESVAPAPPSAQGKRTKSGPADCSKTTEPVRCEQHQKARLLCKDKLGPEHRQCLRDKLTARK